MVPITTQNVLVYIGLGANTGDPELQLSEARASIEVNVGHIVSASREYLSEPWGEPNQPWFRNQVIVVESSLKPESVMMHCLDIESKMGRERHLPNAPRPIDLDILFYGDRIIKSPSLEVPHPRFHQRNFVLIPMMEIAADFVDPRSGQTIEELYLANQDLLEVCLPEENV